MVDPWEVEKRQYTRTLHVLKHVESELRKVFNGGGSNGNTQPVAKVFQSAGEVGGIGQWVLCISR